MPLDQRYERPMGRVASLASRTLHAAEAALSGAPCGLLAVRPARSNGAEVFEAICVLERAAGREGTGNDVEHLVPMLTWSTAGYE